MHIDYVKRDLCDHTFCQFFQVKNITPLYSDMITFPDQTFGGFCFVCTVERSQTLCYVNLFCSFSGRTTVEVADWITLSDACDETLTSRSLFRLHELCADRLRHSRPTRSIGVFETVDLCQKIVSSCDVWCTCGERAGSAHQLQTLLISNANARSVAKRTPRAVPTGKTVSVCQSNDCCCNLRYSGSFPRVNSPSEVYTCYDQHSGANDSKLGATVRQTVCARVALSCEMS